VVSRVGVVSGVGVVDEVGVVGEAGLRPVTYAIDIAKGYLPSPQRVAS